MRPLMILLAVVCIGCDMPRDPHDTTIRIRGGTIRVGASEHGPWVQFDGDVPAGVEVRLLQDFARLQHAEIRWVEGSESELFQALKEGQLEVLIGGLDDSTPWAPEVALSQPFITVGDKRHVMAVRQGENRWLLELDRFLQARSAVIGQLLEAEVSK